MYGYKSLKTKNRDNLIEVKLLLFTANFAINNISS